MSPRALICLAAAAAPTTRAPPTNRSAQAGEEPPATAEETAARPVPRATATITLLDANERQTAVPFFRGMETSPLFVSALAFYEKTRCLHMIFLAVVLRERWKTGHGFSFFPCTIQNLS